MIYLQNICERTNKNRVWAIGREGAVVIVGYGRGCVRRVLRKPFSSNDAAKQFLRKRFKEQIKGGYKWQPTLFNNKKELPV